MDGLTRQLRRYTNRQWASSRFPSSPPSFLPSFLSSVTFHRDSESPFRNIEHVAYTLSIRSDRGPRKTTGIAINEKPCVESRPVQRFAILFAVFVDLSRNACRASIDRFALNVFLEEEFELGDKFGKGSFSFCRKRLEGTRGWLSRKF